MSESVVFKNIISWQSLGRLIVLITILHILMGNIDDNDNHSKILLFIGKTGANSNIFHRYLTHVSFGVMHLMTSFLKEHTLAPKVFEPTHLELSFRQIYFWVSNMYIFISPIILKNCATAFALPLCLIINNAISTCVFPDKWKLSYVTPIFKAGSRNNGRKPSSWNCYSLSDRQAIWTVDLQKYMYKELQRLISEKQHGYVKGRSTVSNLLEYTFFILKSMEDLEDGLQVDSIYTDFSKAFDWQSTASVASDLTRIGTVKKSWNLLSIKSESF
jgi:hypothetical protein